MQASAGVAAAEDLRQAMQGLAVSTNGTAPSTSEDYRSVLEAVTASRTSKKKSHTLAALDDELRKLHELKGTSFGSFKKEIKHRGICLSNCREYGSARALAEALRNNRKLIVSRKDAKEFKYVKQCLVSL